MWKPQVRYLTCADPENFLEVGGGGHLQTRVGPAPYQWSRHKFIKMGRSWHRFLSGGGGVTWGNFGTGVRPSILKPTLIIYLAFEKYGLFIYLIVHNVEVFICCPLIL